jgi:hypothetical protein
MGFIKNLLPTFTVQRATLAYLDKNLTFTLMEKKVGKKREILLPPKAIQEMMMKGKGGLVSKKGPTSKEIG